MMLQSTSASLSCNIEWTLWPTSGHTSNWWYDDAYLRWTKRSYQGQLLKKI